MLLTKYVKIEITKRNINRYKTIYKNKNIDIKIGLLEIPINILPKGSHIIVDFLCEECGDIRKIKYKEYNKNINKRYCRKCNNRNNMLEKYNINKIEDIDTTQNIETKKRCRLCGEYKEYSEYHKSKDGLRSYCKECRKNMTLEYRKRNSKDLSIKQMLYDKEHKHKRIWKDLLRNSLKRLGREKQSHTIDELGYSALELKEHLENLFAEGMSWKNYGEWHIDHIKPLSKFDKETPSNVVNSLSNLQPLWANDNLSKSNNY